MPRYFEHKGKKYRSKKHPLLEHIFFGKTKNGTTGIGNNHTFLLSEISDAYEACGIAEPVSISNTILDLTRKNTGIQSRLPQSIIDLGYDLRKRTGPSSEGGNYAGEFVYVGFGNTLKSWFEWPDSSDTYLEIINVIPSKILNMLSNDEGALFSAIDYCDVLSYAIYDQPLSIKRVQNPVKWQPNEIDGLYFSDFIGKDILFPVEAKALSTQDDINLEQMQGALNTILIRPR